MIANPCLLMPNFIGKLFLIKAPVFQVFAQYLPFIGFSDSAIRKNLFYIFLYKYFHYVKHYFTFAIR